MPLQMHFRPPALLSDILLIFPPHTSMNTMNLIRLGNAGAKCCRTRSNNTSCIQKNCALRESRMRTSLSLLVGRRSIAKMHHWMPMACSATAGYGSLLATRRRPHTTYHRMTRSSVWTICALVTCSAMTAFAAAWPGDLPASAHSSERQSETIRIRGILS